ncbi:MAG: sulfite exporter TauE/SafE family protein [Bacteroidia bacterium]
MLAEFLDIDLTLWQLAIILVAGLVTGAVNTLAGSGSLVTLPIFIFLCGLPAPVANGTNRIGVILQSAVSVFNFRKHGNLPLEGVGWLLGPSIAGSLIGSLLAVDMSSTLMYRIIGGLMIFMLGIVLLKPKRWLTPGIPDPSRHRQPLTLLIFTIIGLYGGIIQAGVGIFLLSALVLRGRYNLIQANALKSLAVLVFNIPAIIVFIAHDQVHWGYGAIMAVAQMGGAVLGTRFAIRVPNAAQYIRYLLILILIAAAVKFFLR